MDDLTGHTLGDYRILRRLGRGAMAEVYLADQQSLGRQVALKVLNANLADDETYVARFQREARAAAALVHANIVQIYEVGVAAGRHFIAQEYVAGRNVGELITRDGPLAPGVVLDVLRQVAAALCRASEACIVHRDIKPENLMFARSGEVKVADFGLARANHAGVDLTQIGVTMGTPLYMSPEQVEGRPVDARSDLYSLGVTAYHMLAGAPPFNAETPLAVAVQHLNREPPPLAEQRSPPPDDLCQLVHRLLAKKPDDRPDGPARLLADLRSLATRAAREGWAAGPEQWPAADTLTAIAAPETARLGELMAEATQLEAPQQRGGSRRQAAVLAACLSTGLVIGLATRPAPLLQSTPEGPVEKATVLEQLYHAKIADTEAAWRAVARRFPDADKLYLNLASQGLARHYLEQQDYPAARPLCQRLADLGEDQEAFWLFGVAGSIVCDVALGEPERAERTLSSGALVESLPRLAQTDPQLYEALRRARRRLRNGG